MSLSTLQTLSKKDEYIFVRENLNIYLQHQHQEVKSCITDLWPKEILREDFLGGHAQQNDYILALLAQGAYHKNWRNI
ncbi:hypothetical protein [Providencia rettgeri]|nr:hypothetical protein [Providencia rettgeri]